MDDILNPPAEGEKVEGQPQTALPEGDAPQGGEAADGGATTAPQGDARHVPLAALEAERTQRQDWKEKAIRYEEELKALRAHTQAQQPAQQLDPMQQMRNEVINQRFDMSEELVRSAHADTDEKVGVFMEAARANPALALALQQQRHPWKFAYDEGARMLAHKEIGNDPAAYRERVKAEVLAEFQKANGSQPSHQSLNLPASLNGARSVAPRSAPGFTGPTPFESILPGRV